MRIRFYPVKQIKKSKQVQNYNTIKYLVFLFSLVFFLGVYINPDKEDERIESIFFSIDPPALENKPVWGTCPD
jgi:hypothetical protein